MAVGFAVNSNNGMHEVIAWIEGAPEKSFWGIKLWRKRKLEIETWRCGRCGFLESYAP